MYCIYRHVAIISVIRQKSSCPVNILNKNRIYSVVENHVLWAWSEINGYASLLFSGVMEYWSVGLLVFNGSTISYFLCNSNFSLFHYSITPILQEIHEREHGVKTPF